MYDFIILIPALIISAFAQLKITSTFNRYKNVRSMNGITGAQAARRLLDSEGLFDVPVQIIGGNLTDNYDPSQRTLFLSNDVYYGNSVASLGVAAHETGHAIQHKESYTPLSLRNAIVPAVNISSNLSWVIFILGMIMGSYYLVNIGIYLFGAVVIFQLVTLPVEFNASRRALKLLKSNGILYEDEISGARSVLSAAAMTYVAAALMAIAQFIRLIIISNNNRND